MTAILNNKVYVVTDNGGVAYTPDYSKVIGVFTDIVKARRGIKAYLDSLQGSWYSNIAIDTAKPNMQIEYFNRTDEYVYIYIEKMELNGEIG